MNNCNSKTNAALIRHLTEPERMQRLEATAPGFTKRISRLAEKTLAQNLRNEKRLSEQDVKDRAHRRRMDWIDRLPKITPIIIGLLTALAATGAASRSDLLMKFITALLTQPY